MVWRRAVLAAVAVVAACATETSAQFACPDGQFPVSVLDDPQVKCLASRPCSGVYGPEGLVIGVGACPSGTGCALLPHNPSVMGCVAEGRADVSYVNPDGSLTKGGKVISGPPTSNNDGGANNNGGGANNSTAPTTAPTATSVVPTSTTTSPSATTTTPGQVKPGDESGSSGATTAPTTDGSASNANANSPTPTTTPSTSTTQQNALDDINGEIANNKRGVDTTNGLGLSSIIAIVVGCLAVVAVIAGVFVLRKKKEQSIGTPEGGVLDDYGAGGVTPKENVLLL